jgi:hypothetical protein
MIIPVEDKYEKDNLLGKCSECGHYIRVTDTYPHGIECSEVSMEMKLERWKRLTQSYKDTMERNSKAWRRNREETNKWQNKFHQLRHENNKLRSRLRRILAALKAQEKEGDA